MFRIGCHISAAGGYLAMGKTAEALGANSFAFFTRNPRGGASKALDEDDVAAFLDFAKARDIGALVAHAPYTLNPCAEKDRVREFARQALREDLKRMEATPGQCYNFHPGSHVGQGVTVGIEKITEILNEALFPEMRTTVLLETMAGKGSEVGGRFEELRAVLDGVALPDKMGVCFDTCHVWDAGYDIVRDLDGVLTEFDRVVGLERIRAVHLNNSKNDIGSHKDRHEKIDEGFLPMDAIRRIITHEALRELPFILETPNENEGYAREIRLLRELRGE